ncbi:MAG: conjugative transposon protein TraJ, partial [Segetibacter sp.]
TVPSVANYIVHAGGGNTLLYKVSNLMTTSSRSMLQGGASSATSMVKDMYGNTAAEIRSGAAVAGAASNYFKDKLSGGKSDV